ncbi:DNA internalization-related competence protein ComEC/Rec2 [Lacticaseibacillus camelliae]|uniref:Metallo-beta-lactamase superfamily hydrolase protein n=2 Tax=Lacticaseibacillus camelliae TaxID=381742 RepID=A0A0R2F938_9LACO|nr:DNA internalization-related competence protein ComEC/Rec2 [Lacticaseibacillus camelliae]KRN21676.1 metallo-beta-lactamase superfamily hydrolase protein [Lacticaseibacillus camelliae DSM 22697 = JCM 13995]
MNRRGIFLLAAGMGGMLVFMQPWWLGLLLIGWALFKAARIARIGLLLALVIGLAWGYHTAQLTADPPQPSGAVTVMPTAWQVTGELVRYTGTAANGVPISGSAKVTGELATALRQMTIITTVEWAGDLTRLGGARNPYEFDYAIYAWRQNQLAWQSQQQTLQLTARPARGIIEQLHVLRAKVLLHLRQLAPRTQAYAKGLLLGQVDSDFAEQREAFVTLGIFHLFSVSGLHLYALIGALYWLTDRLRLPKEAVDWSLLGLLPTLLVLIPPAAGIMRAVWLRIIAMLNDRFVWQWTPLDCFSAAVALNLGMQPYVLHTMGGQLTYLLCFVLLVITTGRWGMSWRLALVSTPVVLFHTFRVHLLASVFSWLLMPVFELALMPVLVVVSIWPHLPGSAALETVLVHAEKGLTALAALPGEIIFGAVPAALAAAGVVLVLVGLAFGRWQWLGGWVILTWLVVNVHPQYRVTMFDVGQGDSLLIEAPFKQGAILIDTGGRGFGFSANPPAKRVIVNYLRARGITHLDALVLTHADADHVGDAAVLTRLMPVKTLVTTPLAASHPYILAAKAGRVTQHVQVLAGQTLAIGPLKLRVVAPSDASATEKNADSIVLYGKIGDSNWLFTGDADQGVETRELMPQALEVDMLKVGHHGSKTSSAPEFIQQIKPKLALISAGVNNRYGHPHQETLTTLQAAGVPWLNTAAGGAVWVDASSKALSVHQFLSEEGGP